MITTTLAGGLGNQMFMYAFTKSLALSKNTAYAFDIKSGFANDITFKRQLELCSLNVRLPESKLRTCSIGVRKLDNLIKKISRMLQRNILLPSYRLVMEDENCHYQPEIFQINSNNLYLEGYWQSPRYFEKYNDIIRSDFNITSQIPQETLNELDYWKSFNRPLVFVGVRRYQECNPSNVTWGVCGPDYYKNAMRIIEDTIDNPLFIVFSQDIEWCKRFIHGDNVIYAEPKSGPNSTISDLFLMKECDHAIISNSSFYWWGAWLQENSKHVVVASDNFMNKDFACNNWIVL